MRTLLNAVSHGVLFLLGWLLYPFMAVKELVPGDLGPASTIHYVMVTATGFVLLLGGVASSFAFPGQLALQIWGWGSTYLIFGIVAWISVWRSWRMRLF